MPSNDLQWEISNKTTWLGSSIKELYSYKDLLFSLVRKDILTQYQQTLFGPLWVLLLPLMTVLTYVVVFHKVLQISTGGIPHILYYLSGIILWTLFSDTLLSTASTFTKNAAIFGKVYFPRLIVPLATMLLNSFQFAIQLGFLIIAVAYYYFIGAIHIQAINLLLFIPAVIIIAGIGLGAGLIFSVVSAKYRDLSSFLPIIVRLLMFLCPIFYSISHIPASIRWLVDINPLSVPFEMFRKAFMGIGHFTLTQVLYSSVIMILLLCGGLLLFNKMGDQLIDVA